MDGFNVQTQEIDANHMDMCKFSDSEDVGYKRTAGFLADFIKLTVHERIEGES